MSEPSWRMTEGYRIDERPPDGTVCPVSGLVRGGGGTPDGWWGIDAPPIDGTWYLADGSVEDANDRIVGTATNTAEAARILGIIKAGWSADFPTGKTRDGWVLDTYGEVMRAACINFGDMVTVGCSDYRFFGRSLWPGMMWHEDCEVAPEPPAKQTSGWADAPYGDGVYVVDAPGHARTAFFVRNNTYGSNEHEGDGWPLGDQIPPGTRWYRIADFIPADDGVTRG